MNVPIKMKDYELSDFKAGYELHKKIQQGLKSIFNLSDEESDIMTKGICLIEKYTSPDDIHDDEWEWVNSQVKIDR